MKTRAKFKVDAVSKQDWGTTVQLSPVGCGLSKENEAFWNATPSGSITMNITNTDAADQFEVGKEVYVDFTDADTEVVAVREFGMSTEELIATQMEFGFEDALALLKSGHKLARKGWNGSGMFVYLVPAASYPATTENAREHFGDMVPYRQYLALKTVQNDVATWAPSGSDALAEDWIVIE